ncbi:MAG: lantibiotic immunity ABC transporter MutG family permease subunit [Lachnospiraceae bacterium]|nr:lantibiotic immunity ABC transporter MutG family permease subunit [Lachnospiraceae bacterium]
MEGREMSEWDGSLEGRSATENSVTVVWRGVLANLYKLCHLKLLWVHIGLPLFAVVVFRLYFAVSHRAEAESVELYLQAVSMAFPLMIALVVTMVCESDRHAGGFQVLQIVPADRASGHIGNLAALLVLGMVASGIAVVGYYGIGELSRGLGLSQSQKLQLQFYVNLTLLLFSVNIASYLLQYVVCYTFGKGASLCLGVVGTLLAPLMYLGLGDGIWYWVLCSYGIRMVSYYLRMEMPLQERNAEIMQYICTDFRVGAQRIVIVTILAGVLFYVWGKSWQGTKKNFD